jgi:hypothetical protein
MGQTSKRIKLGPVSLAERKAKDGLITPERAKKLGEELSVRDIPEGTAGKITVLQVSQAPLDRMHRRDQITQSEFEAGDRFRTHYYASGLDPMRAVDFSRPYVDGGEHKPEPEFRAHHLQEYKRAVQSVRAWNLTVLKDVLLDEKRFEDCVAIRSLYASPRDWQIAGMTMLRVALRMLVDHFGLPRDWKDG